MYRLNPHKHLKIWFQWDKEDPNGFINIENSLRLIKFREQNPNDSLTLIYSKYLLTDIGLDNLLKFCNKFAIKPLSFGELKKQMHSEVDKKFIALAEEELKAVKNERGGNLAVASDFVRRIQFVTQLGIYSDLDIFINTQNLPEYILVKAPIISSYGTIKLLSDEAVVCINDVITIPEVNPDLSEEQQETAKEKQKDFIDKINNFMLRSYVSFFKHFEQRVEQEENLCIKILGNMNIVSQFLSTDPRFNTLWHLKSGVYGNSPLEIRYNLEKLNNADHVFKEIMLNNYLTRSFVECFHMKPKDAKQNLSIQTDVFKFYAQERGLSDTGDEKKVLNFISREREMRCFDVCQLLVIHTSGPHAYLKIFSDLILNSDEVKNEVVPCSLIHYGLDKHFISKCPTSFQAASQPNLAIGDGTDLSWTQLGREKVKIREQKIIKAAEKILYFYRSKRKSQQVESENDTHEVKNSVGSRNVYTCAP